MTMTMNGLFQLALLVALPMGARAQTCRSADEMGQSLVSDLKKLVSTTDQRVISARDSFYRVPAVPVSGIVLVTSDSICAAAAQALNSLYSETKSRTVYVVSLGSSWAVMDPADDPTGRYLTVLVFDQAWAKIGGYSGP
jgi:hypothetical protein